MLNQEDKQTLQNILNKDEQTLFKFYRQHKKPLLHFIYRSIKDRQDAEEVLQDAFFAFIESLRDFRGQSTLKTFLYSITKNKIIDKLRKKKIKKILFSHLPVHFVESIASLMMDDELDRKDISEQIEKALDKLPNDYALALRLKYKEGYKVAEIAKKIRLSFKATESLIFRARKAFVNGYTQYERQTIPQRKKKV